MTEFSSLKLFLLYNQSMERSIAKFFDQPTFLRIKKTWEMFFVPVASGLGEKHWQSMPIDKHERLKLEANLNPELTRRREKRRKSQTQVTVKKGISQSHKNRSPTRTPGNRGITQRPNAFRLPFQSHMWRSVLSIIGITFSGVSR